MAINQDFIDAYKKLLIFQYSNFPKAAADIEAKASHFSKIFDLAARFVPEFDVDNATNHRLDILGKIVVFDRILQDVVPKKFFGFDDNPLATGMDDAFNAVSNQLYPFQDAFEDARGSTELSDEDYRLFIKAKISKNTGSGSISDDSSGRIGIQNALLKISDGLTVQDNYDMTITITADATVDPTRYNIIQKLDLIPRPQGVKIIYL